METACSSYHVFNATVLSLRVLANGDQVDVGVGGLVTLDGHAGTHVGVEVKGLPQQEVHGGVASCDGGLQGPCVRETRELTTQHCTLLSGAPRTPPSP